jgi:hypothetical protein
MKLEKVYRENIKYIEANSIKDNEGKVSPNSYDCNNYNYDDVECSPTNEE